jgi:hypothetical protein
MKNFYRLAENMDIVPLMSALKANPDLWNENTLRTDHPETAHSQVSDIWLRFNDVSDESTVMDDRECINYPAIFQLPEAQHFIFWLMARVKGERVGRCLITELTPGKCITPHVDSGAPASYYERYHVVLSGHKGSVFRAGDEQVTMLTGDVWWFDNQQEHEVINNSADDRIHMIIDIKVFR